MFKMACVLKAAFKILYKYIKLKYTYIALFNAQRLFWDTSLFC